MGDYMEEEEEVREAPRVRDAVCCCGSLSASVKEPHRGGGQGTTSTGEGGELGLLVGGGPLVGAR